MGFFNFLRPGKGARARTATPPRPQLSVEGLESRVVPYALSGTAWPHPEMVTISFVPDGTVLGSNANGFITSNLFSSFTSKFGSDWAWQSQVLKAAQAWAQQTNINFAVVPDDGADIGAGDFQQGAPTHGDIRIGGYNFGTATLAQAYVPPPMNNYSIAGDLQFNTGKTWNINNTYDIATVALHEIGHSLGLYHSPYSTAAMYANYQGVRTTPSSDDINGIRSIYGGSRTKDSFDGGSGTTSLVGSVVNVVNSLTSLLGLGGLLGGGTLDNNSFGNATPLDSFVDPTTKTAVVSGVDITTTSDVDYYSFTAPQGTNSSVTITAQSAGLSLLAPTLTVYNANQTVAGTVSGAGQYGTTLQLTLNNVTEGQQFYVKVAGADTSAFGTGRYALTLNMGSGATPAVPLPNTQVLNGDPLSAGGGQAMLLSIEGQVNSYSAGDQKADGARAVGMDAAGNYVVVWSSNGQDGGGWGVYGRRYTVGGVPLGGEFRVNTTTAGDQNTPAVAVNADGSFVVVWQSNGQDGGGWGIYARRYDAAGNALGGEFRVNTTTAGDQKTPAVAVDATGDFVVTWSSNGQDGGGWGIYGQRYDAAGNALGGEFRVNTTTAGDQKDPQVAMAAAGDFVVVWVSNNQDGDKAGVYGQRYSANGTALGGEFQANTYTTGDQNSPALAMDAAGDFVVTWSSNGQDGRGWGVYGRRYDANGVAGNAFHVSNTTAGDQEFTTVAMDAAGNFVIGWSSHGQDGNGWGSYGRQFNLAGIALGNEFQIASSTAGDQVSPTWAVDSNGHAVAVWSGSGMAADSSGVFMQRFALSVGDNANALDGDYTPPGASTVGLPCCCPGCRGTAAAGQDPTGSLAANGTAGHTGMPGCTCPSCMGAVTNGSVVRGELDQLSSQPREPLAAPLALGALAPGFADTVVAPMSLPTKATTDAARFVLPPPLQDAFAVATSPSAIQASATRATDVPPSWVRSTGDGRSGLMMVRRLGLVAGNEEDTRVRTSLERTPGWRSVALWPRVCSESFADVSWLDEPVPDANNAAEEGTVPGLSSALIAGLAAALVIPPSGEGLPADGRDRRPDLQPRSD